MRYLGSVTLDGALSVAGQESPASLELECYELKDGVIHGAGEVTGLAGTIRSFSAPGDIDFLTSGGRKLKLRNADRKARIEGRTASVIASGDLPMIKNGSAEWPAIV